MVIPSSQPLYLPRVKKKLPPLAASSSEKYLAPVIMLKPWKYHRSLGGVKNDEEKRDTHDVLAVSVGGFTALVLSQLHETLFAVTANCGRIAATLLESDRGQENGRNWR